jgi:DNA adenine methylase
MPSIIRYPGSKAKLAGEIIDSFPSAFHDAKHERNDLKRTGYSRLLGPWHTDYAATYFEPFFGSGAIGLKIIDSLPSRCSVWINDIDHGMYAIWKALCDDADRLKALVAAFTPSVDAFYELKAQDGKSTGDLFIDALHKIALHRMSMSGFGAKSGGPIGGRRQDGGYTVDCRWTPASIIAAIQLAKQSLFRFCETGRMRITNLHFRDVLAEVTDASLVYLDPPYYVKGGQLYAHNMSDEEHAELASILRDTPADWRLSYDDCPRVRELYAWASFRELEIRYTNAVTKDKRPKNRELLISPPVEDAGDYVGMGWVGKDGQP